MGSLFFSLDDFVTGTPVWCGEGCCNIKIICGNLFFPIFSKEIYFSSALV